MPKRVPTSTHEARLKLGKWDNLRAHVLDDQRRVLSQDCVAYILQAKSPAQVQTSITRWSQHPTLRNSLNAEEKLDLCQLHHRSSTSKEALHKPATRLIVD